jgi:hypothetical protein
MRSYYSKELKDGSEIYVTHQIISAYGENVERLLFAVIHMSRSGDSAGVQRYDTWQEAEAAARELAAHLEARP